MRVLPVIAPAPSRSSVLVASDHAQGPLVDVVVGIHGTQHTVTASVEDREHMAYQVLLGRDVRQHYHVDVTRRPGGPTDDVEE